MKNLIITSALAACFISNVSAQNHAKESLSVLSIDAKGVDTDPYTMGNMVRIELDKLGMFNVMDKYDVQQFIEQNKLGMQKCYGKACLTEMGALMKVDKMFTGGAEHLGKLLVIEYRLIDVKTSSVQQVYVREFQFHPEEIQNMVKLSIAEMFGKEYDKNLMAKLSKPYDYDNSNNNPELERLALDGPRMGFVTFTGELRDRISAPKTQGGFGAVPVMFQFGYQFEKQYLNEGKLQALFEFIPMITGLDQGYFIPSAALLHGVRSNIDGWEFAFGPTFNVVPFAEGYYDGENNWTLKRDWTSNPMNQNTPIPYEITERIDVRGDYRLHSAFVIAAGRTFRSGKLNMPVNAFLVTGKNGMRAGISFGFNAKNTRR
jgi:hypothetical protein